MRDEYHNCGHHGEQSAPRLYSLSRSGKNTWGHAFVVLPHERGRSRLHLFCGEFFFGGVVRFYVVVEDLDELGDDLIALQRGEETAVHVNRRFGFLECSWQ